MLKSSYRDYLLFMVGINTGLKISDMLALKVADVRNRSHITVREQSTGRDKRYAISANLKDEIARYVSNLPDGEYLFRKWGKTNAPISKVQAYNILNQAGEKVGVKIGSYTLRKTFGYHFYQRTRDIKFLQELFNQSAPCVTYRYIGIDPDMVQEGADQRRGAAKP